MARRHLIRSSSYPYHITARSNNQEWFYLSQDRMWEILLNVLAKQGVRDHLKIHALVLMTNHLHLVASSVTGDLDQPMLYLLREVCRKVNYETDRINHLFGGPYKWSLITNTSYYLHCLKYVYRNPIAAGICDRVEDYKYSSILAHGNPAHFPLPLHHWKREGDWLRWGNFEGILDWMNTAYPSGFSDYLKRGLRHREFEIPKNRNTRQIPDYFVNDLKPLYDQGSYPN